MEQKTIFFDCYQTLIDIRLETENQKADERHGWEKFTGLLRQNYGVEISADYFIDLLVRRRRNFYSDKDKAIHHHNLCALASEVLEKDLQTNLTKDEISFLIYEYRKISRGYVNLYPKVADTLAVLTEKYTLAVASYTQGCFTQPELRELDIEKYFSYFIYSSDIGFRKTSPDFYLKCLQIVKRSPTDCIMVGDNYREDVLVPEQIGMNAVWIKNPITFHESSDSFLPPKNMLVLQNFDRLPQVIAEIF